MGKLDVQIIKLHQFLNYMPNPDVILNRTGQTVEVYKEMDATDGKISSLTGARKNEALRTNFHILPTGQERVDEYLTKYWNPESLFFLRQDMMDALKFGFKPAEIYWRLADGFYIFDYYRGLPPEYFEFDQDGNMFFLGNGEKLPCDSPYRFLVHRNGGTRFDNPYGNSLFSPCYWPWQFKRMGFQFWMQAAELIGVPSLVAIFETDDNPDRAAARATILAAEIANINSGSAGALANVKELVQVNMSSSLKDFEAIVNTCNAEISYAITGQTLATGESQFGARAQAEVHERTFAAFVGQDARALAATIQELVGWGVRINFPGAQPPKVVADVGDYATWDQVREAIDRRVPVSKESLYSRYGLPKPKEGESGDSFVMPETTPMLSLSDIAAGRSFFLRTKAENR